MASLRIGGDALDPDEITAALGCEPSRHAKKGEVFDKSRARSKTGTWQLDAENRSPGDVDAQVRELLGLIHFDQWDKVIDRYEVDIFCGLFMAGSDEGFSISDEVSAMLGERKIRLEVCLYGPSQRRTE
ncbi:MAG: DUF4279 domain-containing protein [Pseudomonadota bacterium]